MFCCGKKSLEGDDLTDNFGRYTLCVLPKKEHDKPATFNCFFPP